MSPRAVALAAALLASSWCVLGAIGLLVLFGAVRYEQELVINLISLVALTLAFAVPGGLLMLVATLQVVADRRFPPWTGFAIAGIVVASIACVALAIAADCMPHCNGRGGVDAGLVMAVPAGFAAGALCYVAWLLAVRVVHALNRVFSLSESPPA